MSSTPGIGLPLDRRLALVALGAGNINDTSHQTGAVVAALQRLGVDVCDADRYRRIQPDTCQRACSP